MIDSELAVNTRFNINHRSICKATNVPSNRDDAVSEYVRMRLQELGAGQPRGWQKKLAARAGVVPSVISHTKGSLGVGTKNGPKFAAVLGFTDFDALREAAYRWWLGSRSTSSGDENPALAQPEVERAIKAVDALSPGAAARAASIVAAYSHPRFRDRDRHWWAETLLREMRFEARVESPVRAAERNLEKHQHARRAETAARERAAIKPRRAESRR